LQADACTSGGLQSNSGGKFINGKNTAKLFLDKGCGPLTPENNVISSLARSSDYVKVDRQKQQAS
jgi:hypothetical protein